MTPGGRWVTAAGGSAPWVLVPAAAPVVAASPGTGAALSSPLEVVSASSGVAMGSWAPGPALGWGDMGSGMSWQHQGMAVPGHGGVWPLTCGRADHAALGTDRQTWRGGVASRVLPSPAPWTPALTWEGIAMPGHPVQGQDRGGSGHQHPHDCRPHHRRVGLEGGLGWKRVAAISPWVPRPDPGEIKASRSLWNLLTAARAWLPGGAGGSAVGTVSTPTPMGQRVPSSPRLHLASAPRRDAQPSGG